MFGSKRLRIRLAPTRERTAWKRQHVQPQASKVQYLDLRGKGKFRNKQALIPCRYDEYGIGDLKRRVMIKCTYLYRELMLRLNARKITETYCRGVANHGRVAERTRLNPEGEYSGVSQ